MKNITRLVATIICSTTILLGTVAIAQAGEGGAASSAAIKFADDVTNRILSTSTAAAVGKNGAASSARTDLTDTYATAVGGAGTITVQGVNTLDQTFQLGTEDAASLGREQANKLTKGVMISPSGLLTLP